MLMQRLLTEECPAAVKTCGHGTKGLGGKNGTYDDGILSSVDSDLLRAQCKHEANFSGCKVSACR